MCLVFQTLHGDLHCVPGMVRNHVIESSSLSTLISFIIHLCVSESFPEIILNDCLHMFFNDFFKSLLTFSQLVLISRCCCNKSPPQWCLRTAHILRFRKKRNLTQVSRARVIRDSTPPYRR